jgi:hypothetical protein
MGIGDFNFAAAAWQSTFNAGKMDCFGFAALRKAARNENYGFSAYTA